ncbi:MAG: hypothetical protein KIS73_12330 [Enhydrobacter sp.]|nr:hypothetical protein [Enhydrobacter sp.]
MPLRQRIARVIALFLLPVGLLCVGVPFWMFTLPGRSEIIDDTRAAFGAGTDAGKLKAAYVDCVRERSGSSSSRGVGITEYDCVIDLSDVPEPAPVPTADRGGKVDAEGGDSYAGLTYEEAMAKWNASMAEHTRSVNAAVEALAAQRRARGDASNRLTRKLATNRSGELPAVRILSAPGESRRIGLVWGFGELAWRWVQWLVISLLFFGFGGGCLLAVWVAWTRRPAGA